MIPSGLFTQIGLVALSIGVILTYIMPTFDRIGGAQEEISTYQTERSKVMSVNTMLAAKVQEINNVSSADLAKLRTYMPDSVDPIAVLRDIETIAAEAGVEVTDITDAGAVDNESDSGFDEANYGTDDPLTAPVASEPTANGPYPYAFVLSVDGTYTQIKELVNNLEKNNYPLEIQELQIVSEEGGFLSAEFSLYTYAKDPLVVDEVRVYEDVNVTYE